MRRTCLVKSGCRIGSGWRRGRDVLTAAPAPALAPGLSRRPGPARGRRRTPAPTSTSSPRRRSTPRSSESCCPTSTRRPASRSNIEEAPYDSVVQKATLDASTSQGQYDVVSLPYEFLGAFAENGWITPLDDRLAAARRSRPASIRPRIIPSLWSASSVWADTDVRDAVQQRRDDDVLPQGPVRPRRRAGCVQGEVRLRPRRPATWKQYRDTAEFFTARPGDTLAGQTLAEDFAGVAMTGKRHVATVLEWMDYGWTYGGGILDDAGQPRRRLPASVGALAYMAGLTPFAQPGVRERDLGRDDRDAAAGHRRPVHHLGRHRGRDGGRRPVPRGGQDGVCDIPVLMPRPIRTSPTWAAGPTSCRPAAHSRMPAWQFMPVGTVRRGPDGAGASWRPARPDLDVRGLPELVRRSRTGPRSSSASARPRAGRGSRSGAPCPMCSRSTVHGDLGPDLRGRRPGGVRGGPGRDPHAAGDGAVGTARVGRVIG